MSGFDRFSKAASMFRPRSGRVSGQQQAAANRTNDRDSMRLDEEELRENLRRQSVLRRGLERKIAQARESGDFDRMDSLKLQLLDHNSAMRDDFRAINPRDTSADNLRAASDRLPEMFERSARGAADIARTQAGAIGGRIDAESERIGRGSLRAAGINPADAERGAPGGAQRLGELATPESASRFGIDTRKLLMEKRRRALDLAGDLEDRANAGFTPTEFDADALAARIAAGDEAARRRAFERQRRRITLSENEDADFAAADTLTDLNRDTMLTGGRTRLTDARTGETVAGTREFLAGETDATARETARDERLRKIAEAQRLRGAEEGELDLLDKKSELAEKELDLKIEELDQSIVAAGSANTSSPLLSDPEFGKTAAEAMKSISEVINKGSLGRVLFDDLPLARIKSFVEVQLPELERFFQQGTPAERERAAFVARQILAESPILADGQAVTGDFVNMEFRDNPIGRALESFVVGLQSSPQEREILEGSLHSFNDALARLREIASTSIQAGHDVRRAQTINPRVSMTNMR